MKINESEQTRIIYNFIGQHLVNLLTFVIFILKNTESTLCIFKQGENYKSEQIY